MANGNGGWSMVNGQWSMVNGQSSIGKQYIIYAAEGVSFRLNFMPGTYSARRYHPASVKEGRISEVKGATSTSPVIPVGSR